MSSYPLRVIAFLFLWWQISLQFRIGPDGSFFVTVVVFAGCQVLHMLAGELAGLSQPLTAALLTRCAALAVILGWLAPPWLEALPVSYVLAGIVGFGLYGAHLRREFEAEGLVLDKDFFREHTDEVMAAYAACMISGFVGQQYSGSVLPLAGYMLIPAIPMSFGWIAAVPQPKTQFNASFGTEDMFEDVGVSGEF